MVRLHNCPIKVKRQLNVQLGDRQKKQLLFIRLSRQLVVDTTTKHTIIFLYL